MPEVCPFCPHALSDHDGREPCSAVPEPTEHSTEGIPGKTWCRYTSRCKHRDKRIPQPYPWLVAIETVKLGL